VRSLERDSFLMERVERLMAIPAVGPITAKTWDLVMRPITVTVGFKEPPSRQGEERRT